MSHHYPTTAEKAKRREARQKILQAANNHRLQLHRRDSRQEPLTLLTERHLQRAVFICRQSRLVKPDVLTVAGFREVAR